MTPCCPKCSAPLPRPASELDQCRACGIYFAKYLAWQTAMQQGTPKEEVTDAFSDHVNHWQRLLMPAAQADRLQLLGWAALLSAMVLWGLWFISRDVQSGEIMESFLHRPNLVFHEAGHILFIPLGEFMSILGGSLFQCLLPLIVMAAFLKRHDPVGASASLWWSGQNLLDVAPYIADARALSLSLIGESSDEIVEARPLRHDWHRLLEQLDLLQWDAAVARLAWLGGSLVMALACGWLGWMLWTHWQQARLQQR